MKTRLVISILFLASLFTAAGFTTDHQPGQACFHMTVMLKGIGSDNSIVTATDRSTGIQYNLPHYSTNTYDACYLTIGDYYDIKACYISQNGGGSHGGYANYHFITENIIYIGMNDGPCVPDQKK